MKHLLHVIAWKRTRLLPVSWHNIPSARICQTTDSEVRVHPRCKMVPVKSMDEKRVVWLNRNHFYSGWTHFYHNEVTYERLCDRSVVEWTLLRSLSIQNPNAQLVGKLASVIKIINIHTLDLWFLFLVNMWNVPFWIVGKKGIIWDLKHKKLTIEPQMCPECVRWLHSAWPFRLLNYLKYQNDLRNQWVRRTTSCSTGHGFVWLRFPFFACVNC